MKIILVIEDRKGKNILFLTDTRQTLTLKEAIEATLNAKIQGVHVVNGKQGPYLRTNPNVEKKDNLDSKTSSYNQLIANVKNRLSEIKNESIKEYIELKGKYLEVNFQKEDLIYIEGIAQAVRQDIAEPVSGLLSHVNQSAQKFKIDKNLLGAILIDELCRKSLDDSLDFLGWFGINTSVGVGQIKLKTARGIIKAGFFPNLKNYSDRELYLHLTKQNNNIDFVAARIRQIIDHWSKQGFDISQNKAVIGQLYSQGLGDPKPDPKAKVRGNQIATEFYTLFVDLSIQ